MAQAKQPEPSETLLDYFRAHPIAYAGFRIIHIHSITGETDSLPESEEVPFISTAIFPILILGYVATKRILIGASRLLGGQKTTILPADGHLFTMTSNSEYRTAPFEQVAKQLSESEVETLLICSPQAEQIQDRFRDQGLSTTTISQLLGDVRLHRIPFIFFEAVNVLIGLLKTTEYNIKSTPHILIFNFILLEAIKRESLRTVCENDPKIHTFSPTPYLIESTNPSSVFVYQHGVQWVRPGKRDFTSSCPPFVPLTYFIWGEAWRSMFERYVHPNSKIVSVGNPWYDTLADSTDEKSDAENIDVLFIGASHTTSTKERNEKYESLVRTVINTCNKKNLNLAIKLHPNGNNDWYRERDWGKYIKEFETIDNAISSSKVLITNTSSTFVESTVLGKPIIVADVYDKQLSNLGPLKNVVFSDGVEEIPELVTGIITGDADIISMLKKGPIPVDLGQSTNQITEYVSNIKTE
jgi:hypothetical protein